MTDRRAQARTLLAQALPPGSTRRSVARIARQVARDGVRYARGLEALWRLAQEPSPVEPDYRAFLARNRLTVDELLEQSERAATDEGHHRVHVIVLDDGVPGAADVTVHSLRIQSAPRWRVKSLGQGNDVDGAIEGVDDGDLVLVARAGDRFEPDLVHQLVARAWDDPRLVLLYWDDDSIEGEQLVDPRFRPGWSPDVLLGANYLDRSFAVRAGRLRAAGGFRRDLGEVAWWELLLRLGLRDEEVERVPRVLGHLAGRLASRPEGAEEVVAAHLAALGRDADVLPAREGVRILWNAAGRPRASILIPTRHNREMLSRCLPSLARTAYPSFEVVVVDNGGRTDEREAWYRDHSEGLDLRVEWWDRPFNYSAVNNHAARLATGDVLVFLNDDTEALDETWLDEMIGWATQPDIGLVGAQLVDSDGRIQHGGVVLGMNGFADHLFEGMAGDSPSFLGPTSWYRDVLSVTAACLAVRRSAFDEVGGFDERFVLCGSDVVLGLDTCFLGLRNVCTPYARVRHLESATRGTTVPDDDFFASYWRYQKWLRAGDPYFSPNLSLWSREPRLRGPDERPAIEKVGEVLDRSFTVFRQAADASEADWLADTCRADDAVVEAVRALHATHAGPLPVETINWFVPDIDSPFYGGINTALRLADHLARHHGVRNQFVVMAAPNERFFRSALAAAFPALGEAPVAFIDGPTDPHLASAPAADVSIATLWVTAYSVARFPHTKRKVYLIQDFEPMFYPAGTQYALAEEGYRLGLYGLCNTQNLLDIYRSHYEGEGLAFTPAVDQSVFHARGRAPLDHDGPVRVFVYARPGHWRNCWELALPALRQLKEQMGDRVEIVTAGSWAHPDDLGRGIEHRGLLDYRETGKLYRSSDVGVALTVSAHPSYLPLELMACGVPVVAFDNPAGDWILHHEHNSLRCRRTVDGLAEALERLVLDGRLRARLGANALADIEEGHADWERAFAGIYDFLVDPGKA